MSKIGKQNINIPEKVSVALSGTMLNIEGPLGKKSLNIDTEMFDVNIKDKEFLQIKPKKLTEDSKRLWGMNRSLVNNAIISTVKVMKKYLSFQE